MLKRIYLDNNATTKVDPEVKKVFIETLNKGPLNPSSIHTEGQEAKTLIAKARRQIADLIGVKSHEVIFTSGSTEGLNLMIRGMVLNQSSKAPYQVITTSIEHSAVYSTLKELELAKHCELNYLPVGLKGAPLLSDLEKALKEGIEQDRPQLVVLSAANSETGIKIDIEGFSKLAAKCSAPFILDATALVGKEVVKIPKQISGAAFSAHKFHGPQGVGFCVIREDLDLSPQSTGGGQEYARRSGTENVAGIVALAKALEIAQKSTEAFERMRGLRDFLEQKILEKCPFARVNGIEQNKALDRLVNTSNIAFKGVEGDSLILSLDLAGLSVSLGSACATGTLEVSRVLLNMGIDPVLSRSSLRFSLSRFTTQEEVEKAVDIVVTTAKRLKPKVSSHSL